MTPLSQLLEPWPTKSSSVAARLKMLNLARLSMPLRCPLLLHAGRAEAEWQATRCQLAGGRQLPGPGADPVTASRPPRPKRPVAASGPIARGVVREGVARGAHRQGGRRAILPLVPS